MKRSPLKRSTTMTSRVPVQRKCKVCRALFAKRSMTHVACSPACAEVVGQAKAAKERAAVARADTKATRAKLEAMKPRAKWLAEAQTVVNRYCRLRDLARGYGCITCGATPSQKFGGTYDAGHLRSVGSAPHLRFYTAQIHLQCVTCNRHQGGRQLDFRRALVARRGEAWMQELEARHEVAKFSIEYLKRLKAVFVKKAKRLEKRMA